MTPTTRPRNRQIAPEGHGSGEKAAEVQVRWFRAMSKGPQRTVELRAKTSRGLTSHNKEAERKGAAGKGAMRNSANGTEDT